MSLRWRWALSIAIVAFLAVAASTATGLVATERELRAQVDRDLRARFHLAMRVVPAVAPLRPFDQSDPFLVRPGPDEEPFEPSRLVGLDAILQISIADRVTVIGDPALPRRSYDDLADGPVIESIEVAGDRYRMISGQVDGPRLVRARRVVQIATAVGDIDEAVATLVRRVVRTGVVLAFAAGAVGWALARRAVQPIERLIAVTDAMTRTTDLEHDLPEDAPGEVGRLAASFRRMLDSLQASRAQQRQLVADAGHEFRTPLTALRTNLETIHRRGSELTEDQRRQLMDAAVAETQELSTLAAELVDLAADPLQAGGPVTAVSLVELAERVANRYRARTTVTIRVGGAGDTVEGRSSQLERAISNLVDNAVKWSPDDGEIEIVLDGRSLSVRDRGPGIPEADLPHVFERFYRAVEARTTPGSGLGLAIVEHIVTAHGGSVFARNRANGGTEAGFRLP